MFLYSSSSSPSSFSSSSSLSSLTAFLFLSVLIINSRYSHFPPLCVSLFLAFCSSPHFPSGPPPPPLPSPPPLPFLLDPPRLIVFSWLFVPFSFYSCIPLWVIIFIFHLNPFTPEISFFLSNFPHKLCSLHFTSAAISSPSNLFLTFVFFSPLFFYFLSSFFLLCSFSLNHQLSLHPGPRCLDIPHVIHLPLPPEILVPLPRTCIVVERDVNYLSSKRLTSVKQPTTV